MSYLVLYASFALFAGIPLLHFAVKFGCKGEYPDFKKKFYRKLKQRNPRKERKEEL